MLAETLALALLLASPGSPRARSGIDATPDNTARARRGLLPRKVVKRAPTRGRRIVLLPQAPTWLGEPGETAPWPEDATPAPELEAVVEPAVAAGVEPAPGIAAPAEEAPPEVSASLEGAEVELLMVRRFPAVAEPEPEPALAVALAEPEVVVLLRRLPASLAP